MRELRKSQKKTDEQIKQLRQEIGSLGHAVGHISEGFTQACTREVFKNRGLFFDEIHRRVWKSKDGRSIEIDVLAVGKTVNEENIIVAIGAKTMIKVEDINELEEKLNNFFDFFPQYKDYKLAGAVATVSYDDSILKYGERKGFYILIPNEETFRILNSNEFKPRMWKSN